MPPSLPSPSSPPRIGWGLAALGLSLGVTLALLGACEGGAGAGASCDRHRDCANSYQCLGDICVPRCESHFDCGDGFVCTDSGICDEVLSAIGDRCESELACSRGQSCILDDNLASDQSRLQASCQVQPQGQSVGARCESDDECRNNLCNLGRCGQLCASSEDCPSATSCQDIPRLIGSEAAMFRGCLQNSGVLDVPVPMSSSSERLRIPVPSGARSFAMVTEVDDDIHRVGAMRVVSPQGELLYNGEGSLAELVANPIRHFPAQNVSTLFVPNNDVTELETGVYQVDVQASLPPFGSGTATPKVTVHYKLDVSRTLDLSFYFVNLEAHPCSLRMGPLDADGAAASTGPFQQSYLPELKTIMQGAGITLGDISYRDIDRPDLVSINNRRDLEELLALSDNPSGIAVFIVRSMSPDGIQAQVGAVPGPPRTPGTASSGIAISADTLCYRDWDSLARVTAHSIAGHMGLFHNRDPDGTRDPISDTDTSADNLMFFGEFGGVKVTDGQRHVLEGIRGCDEHVSDKTLGNSRRLAQQR